MSPAPNTVLVGDPVDVMTGAQFDVALDFRIAWPFPFAWRRLYSSARAAEPLPLGWGHTHAYDHRLWFDVHGLLYAAPTGARHAFAVPAADGRATLADGARVLRVAPHVYRVKVAGQPECEFHFGDPTLPARLARVYRGRAYHELAYAPDGRWVGVACRHAPPVGVATDAHGRVVALRWQPRGDGGDRLLWAAQYDAAGNLVRLVDPYGSEQAFAYDAANRMVGRTDRRGYGFAMAYDAAGRCEYAAGEDGVQAVRLRYLPDLTVVTRADGGEWRYAYEPAGVTEIVDPYGGVTRRAYAPDGRLARETGPAGEVLLAREDEDAAVATAPFPLREGMCLPLGDPWFDAVRDRDLGADPLDWEGYGAGRARSLIRFPASDAAWLRRLPRAAASLVRVATGPAEAAPPRPAPPPLAPSLGAAPPPKKAMGIPGHPGVVLHDAFGQIVSHTLPTGHACRWQYDGNGNVVRHVDYAGAEWRYEYASWNLRVRETDPLGNAVTFRYDPLERLVRLTDGAGTSTDHAYDLVDRPAERWRHGERRDAFGYDRSRGLTVAAAGDAPRVTLTPGPHRRPVAVAPAGQAPRTCEYDDAARLVAVAAEDGETLAFAYDPLGERTADLRNGRGVERRHSPDGLAECVVLGRFVTRYRHDPPNDRWTIVDPLGGRHVVAQLDTGVYLRRHENGTEELAQFDWEGRCLAKVRLARSGRYADWWRVYRYSPVGALVSEAGSGRGTTVYEYDAAHRLVRALAPDGTRETFAYDAGGNLTSAPGLGGVSVAENRLLAANGRRFEYDGRHHVARDVGPDATREYAYDAEDRLTSCVVGGRHIEFRYDALGRRVEKRTAAGTTAFVWDGERLAAEIAPDGRLRVYVYADGDARTPFAFVDYASADADPASGRRYYVVGNQVACPVLVEDDRGEPVWRATIDAYGRARVWPGGRIELNLRWPGHYLDPETGLHYNRYRYYSPELGRYLQVDPRDLDGGVNVYAYPARPLDTVDVDGLAPCPKKAMVSPKKNDKKFKRAKDKADRIAENMREQLKAAIKTGRKRGENMQALENTTIAAMVVTRPKNRYEVVVTANRSPKGLPRRVREAADGSRWIGHGDDRPPPVRQDDESHRYGRDKPTTDDREDTTHNHAEQRGLRANDCDPDTGGVAYIAPTRPCCEGCSTAIQSPHNPDPETSREEGGWGGSSDNVSDRGRQPDPNGNEWWED